MNWSIAIHGGAGTIRKDLLTPELEARYLNGLQEALEAGGAVLKAGGEAQDAVQAAVVALENFPLFNAGRGSVFSFAGKHEMDACIMNGTDQSAGAVAGVNQVQNPVLLARAIKDHSGHVLLSGTAAEEFARTMKLALKDDAYFYEESRFRQWQELKGSDNYQLDHTQPAGEGKKFGTVGAVACDAKGNLAAATSTGGMTNKRYGRIGDSPVPGAGTYANNKTCAVSCTGHGEFFLRAVVAYDISCLMEYKGMALKEACEFVVNDKLVKFGGEGGLVAVDAHGQVALPFNSEGMYRGWWQAGQSFHTAIYGG